MPEHRRLGRLALLVAGLLLGGGIIAQTEGRYRNKEAQLHTTPVFEPTGVKYAYATPPEPGVIRGWVAGMVPPSRRVGVERIVALGDSITYGLGVDRASAWPAALERALDHTEVFNLAMCGWDAEQSISLAVGELDRWQPDMVIWGSYSNDVLPSYLMWGANDDHPVFVGSSIPDEVAVLPAPIALWMVRHSALFRKFQAGRMSRAMKQGLQLGPQLDWYQAQLARLARWSDQSGTPVLTLAIPAHTQAAPERCTEFISARDCEHQASQYRTLTEALGRSGLQWVDGQKIYAATGQPHFMLRPGESIGQGSWENDAEHPTAAGHTALAAGLVPGVVAALHR